MKKKCICESVYDMDEAIILNNKCPIHGKKRTKPTPTVGERNTKQGEVKYLSAKITTRYKK